MPIYVLYIRRIFPYIMESSSMQVSQAYELAKNVELSNLAEYHSKIEREMNPLKLRARVIVVHLHENFLVISLP